MLRRRVIVTAVASLLLAIVGACGGDGGGDGVAFDGETVRSGDGVLTLQIPTGAGVEGVEIEVTRIAEDELPKELHGVDGVVVVGYELGPDGAQFSAPVTLTFRVDPADHGLDLPEGAVPFALLLTENAAGDLESIEGELSNEDGEIVARAAVTHFSPAIFVLSIHVEVVLEPAKIELAVGDSRSVQVVARDPLTGETIGFPLRVLRGTDAEWTATPPFSAAYGELDSAISCTAPTDGWVAGAYRVLLPSPVDGSGADFGVGDAFLRYIGAETLGVKLAGDGKCNGADGSASSAGSSGEPSEGSSTSTGGSAGTTELIGCTARREQQIVLDFSSADIMRAPEFPQSALLIPEQYFQSNGYESGFVTPPFVWSTVPPETTEIAILILRLTHERAEEYLTDPKLWWNQVPTGQIRWVLTGIDPSLASLPTTSLLRDPTTSQLTNPLPAGSKEQDHGSPVVRVDGEALSNKFVGPDVNGREFMFVVFALCDRQAGARDAFREGGLQSDSIAIGWFFAEAQR